jgi:uncharacterized protein YqeY
MTLIAQVQARLTQAMKAGDTPAKSACRMLLSKLQTSNQVSDDQVISATKSLIKQNADEIETRNGRVAMPDGTVKEVAVTADQKAAIPDLEAQNVVLKSFLPTFLSADKIKEILSLPLHLSEIKACKNAGAATGTAIKILKPHGAVEGATVKEVVASLYGQ